MNMDQPRGAERPHVSMTGAPLTWQHFRNRGRRTTAALVLLAATCALGLPPVRAADSDGAAVDQTVASLKQAMEAANGGECQLPQRPPDPPKGHWKGFYRLAFDLVLPNPKVPLKIAMKWEGTLEYDLARYEAPPEPHRDDKPPLRKPLGKTSPSGPQGPSVSHEDFEKAWNRLVGLLPKDTEVNAEADAWAKALLAQFQANYDGIYVGPHENGKIRGHATYTSSSSLNATIADARVNEGVDTKAPANFDLIGDEDNDSQQFKEIWLWGKPGDISYQGGFGVTAPGGSAQGSMDLSGSGSGSYDVQAQGGDGRRIEKSGTVPGQPADPDEKKLLRLKVESTECWEMRGTVDEQLVKDQFKSTGMQVVVRESEWVATLDDRDPEFEKKVHQLAAEPMPPEMTWEFFDHFQNEWQALRGTGKLSDYRLCVLKELDNRAIEVTVVALRTLLNGFPKVRDMNACAASTVLRAAMERILPLVRQLQLVGMDCPLMDKPGEVLGDELRELIKNVLARKHTLAELACIAPCVRVTDVGDQEEPFTKALEDEIGSRLQNQAPQN